VTRFVVSLCLAVPALAAVSTPPLLLKAVETPTIGAGSIQVLFQQHIAFRAAAKAEARVFLRKPGRMRGNTTRPGQSFPFRRECLPLHSASSRQERMKVARGDDLRAPLGFLLGPDFWISFPIHLPPEGERADHGRPKSDRAPYTTVDSW